MYDTLLVPLDGSQFSERALPALVLAEAEDDVLADMSSRMLVSRKRLRA